mgnify:CR=1 FL=1
MKEKILIIEDDFTIQTQLKTLLSGNGYEVFAVTDFSQTIEQLKEAGVNTDLVVLDSQCSTGHAIIQNDAEGDNCILLYGGANQRITKRTDRRYIRPV